MTGEQGPLLELVRVTRRFGQGDAEVRALDDVSMSVDAGELVAVMGPSGSGKSSLLHVSGGLDSPTTGRVLVCGHDIGDLALAELAKVRRRMVGFVFQRLNLVPSLSALENVALPLELDGIKRSAARSQARDALDDVGITEDHARLPETFSGGQCQRIALARAMVGPRRLILADEPTGALDTAGGDAVMDLLARLCAERGLGVLLVTHEPRFAAWADRVVRLRDGRIVDETGAAPASGATGSRLVLG